MVRPAMTALTLLRPKYTARMFREKNFNYIFSGFLHSLKKMNGSRKHLLIYERAVEEWTACVKEALGQDISTEELIQQAAGQPGKAAWQDIMSGVEQARNLPKKDANLEGIRVPSLIPVLLAKLSYCKWVGMVRTQNPGADITKEICDEALVKSVEFRIKKFPVGSRDASKANNLQMKKRLLAASEVYWTKSSRSEGGSNSDS